MSRLNCYNIMRVTSEETQNLSKYPDEIAANGGITRILDHDRYLHRAEFGISIKKEYWGLVQRCVSFAL